MQQALYILIVAFLILTLTVLYKYFTRHFNYWEKKNVPYIKPIPFIGNALPVLTLKQNMGHWIQDLSNAVGKQIFGIFIFDRPVLVVNSPKWVKQILQKDFAFFDDRSMEIIENHPIMSNIMFLSKNPKWKALRNRIAPAFSSGKMKLMFQLMLEEGKGLAEYIGKYSNNPNVDAKEICAKFSTNVIARCAFAIDANSFKNEDAEFRELAKRIFDFRLTTAFRQTTAWFFPALVHKFNIWFFDPYSVKRLKQIFIEVLNLRVDSKVRRGNDLLDIMLEAVESGKEFFDIDALLGQSVQFFVAGFETVSNTMSFTLYELCIHPEIQDRLRKEIVENMNTNNGITYDGISEMKYLDMCVSETLRKYPLLPFLDRKAKDNYQMDDITVEKGTPVYISLFYLHLNPEYWPNPDKYDPERFVDKNAINKDGLNYIPFGEGPRICIGNRFGLIGVKLGLASILSKFKIERSDETLDPMEYATESFLLQPKTGTIPLKFIPL